MAVSGKSKKELIEENKELRARLQELEHSEAEQKNAQEELKKSKEFLLICPGFVIAPLSKRTPTKSR